MPKELADIVEETSKHYCVNDCIEGIKTGSAGRWWVIYNHKTYCIISKAQCPLQYENGKALKACNYAEYLISLGKRHPTGSFK